MTSPFAKRTRRQALGQAVARVHHDQQGSAIPVVGAAVALGVMIVTAFSTNTGVDFAAATNQRDAVRAHFLARSALNLGELVIRLQQRVDNVKELGGIQITDYADSLMLAFCGAPNEVKDALGIDPATIKGLGLDVGTCGVVIDTDDDKINLNCAGGNTATAATLKTRLEALTYLPAFDPVFEEEDADGWRRTREEQVAAILDYIDRDKARTGSPGTPEDYGYENLRDRYQPKDNYLDTVAEAKLIRGVDDRFWNLFGKSFTVYGACKSNIGALKEPGLVASILYLAAKDPNDPVVQDQTRLWTLASLVIKAKQFGLTFSTLDEFREFVADPMASLSIPNEDGSTTPINIPGLAPGTKLGLELDAAKLGQIASAGPRRTYRVEAWGEVTRAAKDSEGKPLFPPIRRTFNGMWDTKVVTQNARNPQVKNGAWLYLREQ